MADLKEEGRSQSARVPRLLEEDNTKPTIHPIIPALKSYRERDKDEMGSVQRSPGRRQWPKATINTARSLTLPPLQRTVTDLGGLRIMNRKPKSPTPNYTMINRRDPDLLKTPNISALITTSKPIPSLLDKPKKEEQVEETTRKNIRIWKDEVKKVVPSRPAIAIHSDWQAPPAEWDDRDQYIYGPKAIFYKNLKYTEHKDFIINPEWLSEFMTVSTYSQAYRTCALRYGWCA